MKRVFVAVIVVLMVAGVAYANHFNVVKKAGDVTVTVVIDGDPIKVGDNKLAIQLLDSSGKSITDADVAVYYFMPSMPAMNYETQATSDGAKYAAVINPVMPGEWDADINVKRNGEGVQTATISFDVR